MLTLNEAAARLGLSASTLRHLQLVNLELPRRSKGGGNQHPRPGDRAIQTQRVVGRDLEPRRMASTEPRPASS